jgi:hypothetical protein
MRPFNASVDDLRGLLELSGSVRQQSYELRLESADLRARSRAFATFLKRLEPLREDSARYR